MGGTVFQWLLLCSCAIQICYTTTISNNQFEVVYDWSYLNFTWPSSTRYQEALNTFEYIPENNAPTCIKIYKGILYISVPRLRNGIPATLAYLCLGNSRKINQPLQPFPSWEMNRADSCSNLQSVQSMEIDKDGVMWVLDGARIRDNINCPTKLVLLDLNNNGLVLYSYIFPNYISLQNGGFLNDIVIDDSDGGFAYITDNSDIDPGLIIYSRKSNRSWKLRDRTMFPDIGAANFVVDNMRFDNLVPIDGIALSPKPIDPGRNRTLFYTSLTGLSLFAISTTVLKDEELGRTGQWRRNVQYVGDKQSQSDGMMMDSKGTLYYTLLPLYGVGRWNIKNSFIFI